MRRTGPPEAGHDARLVAMILAIVASATIYAQRWPAHQTITAWIDPSHAPIDGELLVTRALAAWDAAADGRFRLERVGQRDTAAIRIRFARSDATYGETEPRVDPRTGAIVSADVTVANDVAGDLLTQRIAVYLTALHEIGHALGLPHTDSFSSVMYRFRRPDDGERFFNRYRATLRSAADIGEPPTTGLSDEDVRAVRALYDR